MTSKPLSLGTIKLVNSAESFTLVATVMAELRSEDPSHQPVLNLTKETLKSGKLWVSRAAGFHLEIKILLNDKELDTYNRLRTLESVGRRICDAELWSSISLSTILKIPSDSQTTQFSVKINESITPVSLTNLEPPSLRPQIIGIKPPSGIHCVKLEKVHVQFNFLTDIDMPQTKRRKTISHRAISPEVMPLDYRPKYTLGTDVTQLRLDEVVQSLSGLSDSIVKTFTSRKSPRHGASTIDLPSNTDKSKAKRYPKHVVDTLKAWTLSNVEKPHADESEKIELMKQTGLRKSQITNSLRHYRKKLLKNRSDDEMEMLLDSGTSVVRQSPIPHQISTKGDETFRIPGKLPSPELLDVEMLFASQIMPFHQQISEITPSIPTLTNTSSPKTAIVSTPSSSNPRKHGSNLSGTEEHSSQLVFLEDRVVQSQLVDTALEALVGGHFNSDRSRDTVFGKPSFFEIPLHFLAPCVFKPGFQMSMAQHSKFLPTISRSLSVSVLTRAQSPALKEKLAKLARGYIPTGTYSDTTQAWDKIHALSSVVQSRVWAMIHRNMFEAPTTTRSWRAQPMESSWGGNEDFEDLLWNQMTPSDLVDKEIPYDTEFDDILDNEQGGDFRDYLEEAELEKLAIERETEEMLLGYYEGEHDGALFESIIDDNLPI